MIISSLLAFIRRARGLRLSAEEPQAIPTVAPLDRNTLYKAAVWFALIECCFNAYLLQSSLKTSIYDVWFRR
ncbi:hypothetical protein QBC34DRAFT_397981, partial [Podospora aff. communis PSN243]